MATQSVITHSLVVCNDGNTQLACAVIVRTVTDFVSMLVTTANILQH